MKNDSVDTVRNKTLIFWWVYVLDKGLALRLGRASTIQDYDIDVLPHLETNLGGIPSSHHRYMVVSIDIARIEGKLYEQLYSASSFNSTPDLREQRAYGIIDELSLLQTSLASCRVSLESIAIIAAQHLTDFVRPKSSRAVGIPLIRPY